MRKVILFIATSLDGYIAGKNHDLDWLFHDGDYGYSEFYDSVSTTIMGSETYRQILTFGDFPYKDKENFVFTRDSTKKSNAYVTIVSADIGNFVNRLKLQKGKDIWLIGGGQINTLFLKEDLIDEMIISVHPVILGDGTALFQGLDKTRPFVLKDYKKYKSGLLQITYTK